MTNTIESTADYYKGCVHLHFENKDKEDYKDPFDQEDMDRYISDVYAGVYTLSHLPVENYKKTAFELMKAVYNGFGGELFKFEFGTPDYEMLAHLRKNVYVFSAAKTFQTQKDISALLLDNDGNRRLFSDFKKESAKIFEEYNVNYLKTEFNAATAQSRMASRWIDIQADKETLPLLKYVTVGDSRVREEHKAMDGMIRPVNDPIWKTVYPPNGWNCRCDVHQIQDGEITPFTIKNSKEIIIEMDTIPKLFRMNVGIEKKIFRKSHPYFRVGNKYRAFAKRNFDLPMPHESI